MMLLKKAVDVKLPFGNQNEELKMKTQTFGISAVPFYYIFAQTSSSPMYIPESGVGLEIIKKWFGSNYSYTSTEDSFLSACREAVQNYIAMRANGDVLFTEFPNDGMYAWESPSEIYSKIRYTEGPKDIVWMAEQDKKYLANLKLECEKKLSLELEHKTTRKQIEKNSKIVEKEKLIIKPNASKASQDNLARHKYLYSNSADATNPSWAQLTRALLSSSSNSASSTAINRALFSSSNGSHAASATSSKVAKVMDENEDKSDRQESYQNLG